MFRTKADVDRHVSDILLKIHNDNEKKLRGFTFARLYNQVKDFETSKKYLSGYLSVRDHHAPSHKLMAQLHEATGNFEKSLQCYKRSLEIDSNQRDIVLKICELYCKLSVDHETARYWADRAEQLFPHHEVVFKLRECIISGEGEPDWQEHEKLIKTELATQPYNLNLRSKLLHLYLKMERVKEAYAHATKVEKKKPFRNNKEWYYLLVDIFEAYQNEPDQELDSNFYIMFLSALDHLVYLTLVEPHALPEKPASHTSSNVDDAAAVLLQFDQNLKKAVNKDLINGAWLYFLHHMKGQLYFHLGTLLLKKVKKEQGNWKQACQVGTALFLTGYSFKPANLLQEIWFSQIGEPQQLFTEFFQQGSLRTSFIGHTVLALCKEDKNKWLQKIKHNICLPQVQERTFRQLFSCTDQKINSSESYFLNDTTFVNINLTFPTLTALQEYDTAVFKLCPHSLHHLIWLQLHKAHSKDTTYRENLSEAFKGLQYSNSNFSKGNAESLCLLDLEAFLLATLYTTNLLLEQKSAVINNKNGTTALSMPPDVAEHLCSPGQGNWWKAAHGLVSCGVKMKLGEQRRILQHGLEVIRGIGNHGLEVQLVVHLARAFADQAAALSPDSAGTVKSPSEKTSSNRVSALESRAMHYWSIVLNMLEKLESNQNLPIPKDHIFVGISAALSKEEITMLREEGKLYLACRYMNSGKLENAIEVLERLMSPYASYYLALTYKKMALQESTVAVAKTALLNKARDALFMTMDRIQTDHTHPLNRDIHLEIEDVENEIGNHKSYSNANETFESEDADDYDTADASFSTNSKNGTPASVKQHRITNHSTPRPSASFMNSRTKPSNSIRHVHVEPSPERLDAQIRSLTSTQTTLINTLLEQQRSLLDFNKAIVDQLKTNTDVVIQLKKKLEEFQISNSKAYRPSHKKQPHVAGGQGDEEASGVEDEEDYDPNGFLDYYVDESLEEYNRQQAGYGYPHSGRAVGDTTGSSMGYVPPPGLPPAHYAYQYPPPPPHPGLCPPGTIPAEAPHYYHTPINHGLPFSEGQPLPQFKFHVASPVVKPAVMSVVPQPILQNMPQQPTVPAQTSQPSMSWAKPSLVPHAFQIPLPADIAPPPPTTSQTPMITTPLTIVPPVTTGLTTTPSSSSAQAKNTESPILLKALLQGSPTSTMHGVTPVASTETFSFKTATTSPDTPQLYRSRKDSEACSDTDVEREVMGDFKPAIPLPAEIVVETGEEDEIVLFEDRAKLFRFVDREWKERGIGLVKILKHKDTGNIRLLMRREQVLKICANHLLVPNMAIQYLKGSDKSLTWTAQDFADETVKVELFCIRLKTPEIATAFKKVFEDSLEFVKSNENVNKSSDIAPIINGIIDDAVELTKPGFGTEFLPKPGSWYCTTCCLNNAATKLSCAACETPKPGTPKTTEPSSVTKSPFILPSSLPVISPAPSSTISNIATSKPISFPTPVIASTEGLASKLIPVASQQTSIAPPAVNFSKSLFGNLPFSTSNVFTKLGGAPSDQNQNEIEVSKSDFRTPESKPLFGGITTSLGTTSFETSKSGDAAKVGSTIPFAGFTFSSAPVLVERPEESQDREILVVTTKSKEGPQVVKVDSSSKSSPFAGFSFKANFSKPAESKSESIFKPSTEVSSTSFSPASHSILSPAKTDPPQKFSGMGGSPCIVTVTKDGRRVSTENADATPEEFVPTAEFKPVIPLPALVNTKTGEEGEEKLFGERAKLFRYDTEGKEWKERGTGELKILRNDDKYRILMRRDQVLKICANHYILPGMRLSTHPSSNKSWVWYAQDFADGDLKQEKFAARFKTVEIAQEFHKAFEKCLKSVEEKTSDDESSTTNANVKSETKVSDPCLGNKNSFSNLFKPDPKSWECSACYVRNIDTDCCVSCQSKKTTVLSASKMEMDLWECQVCKLKNAGSVMVCSSCKCSRGNSVTLAKDSTSGDKVKPLSELFKPDPSSWVCDACYVRNDGTKISCSACQTPKPGSAAVQKSSTTTSSSNTFKFGVSAVSTETSSIFGSDPSKNNTSGFIFGTQTDTNSLPTFKFGASSITPSTGFVPSFGTTKPSDGKAVFGDTSFTSTSSSSTTSSLGLGSFNSLFQNRPDLSIAPVTAAPTFVFGKPTNTASQTPSSTILTPSSKEPKQSASNFTFGSVKEPDNKEKEEDEENDDPYEFQFGSPQKYEFNFSGVRPRSPSKSLKSPKSPGSPSDAEDEDEVEPSDVDNIYFQPVIPLPPKVEVITGEENETPLFTSRAKLFRFTEGEWKERGIGDLKILHSTSLKKTRLLMRRDQVLKVCLNHYLKKDMEFSWKGDKSLTWTAVDFSESEPCPEQFAIRFKTPELAQQFHNIVSNTVKDLPSTECDGITTTSSSVATSESTSAIGTPSFAQKLSAFSFSLQNESPKPTFGLSSRFGTTSPGKAPSSDTTSTSPAVDFKSSFNTSTQDSDDIELVYELKATPEQVAKALALKLPPNFYTYESKPPCPGCLGCEDVLPSRQHSNKTEMKENKVNAKQVQPPVSNEALSLFSNSTLSTFSFADLHNETAGFEVLAGGSSSAASFPGAGQRLFENSVGNDENEDGEVAENPDIHFEPIIPLPSLVDVKTGEEDEIPIFCYRAKVYRYDTSSSQWKERGTGDMKILQHREKCSFRLLHRRELVHKVSCNHFITENLELKPMVTSNNSVCWHAIDYSESQPEYSQFAVKFKNENILNEFKSKFDECKARLAAFKNAHVNDSQTVSVGHSSVPQIEEVQEPVSTTITEVTDDPSAPLDILTSNPIVDFTHPLTSVSVTIEPSLGDLGLYYSDEVLGAVGMSDPHYESLQYSEDEEDDDEIMFNKRVTFEVMNEGAKEFENIGTGCLQVLYDDSVYGYRIQFTDDSGEIMSDHIIAIQTCLRTENNYGIWAAIDMNLDPPKRRQFRARFSSKQSLEDFVLVFEEGKQSAVEAEIVENCENFLTSPVAE